MGCRFLNLPRIRFGNNVVINWGCVLDGRHFNIEIGNNVSIGPRATLLTLGHDPQSASFANKGGKIIIGDRVWIGYGSILLPGIEIGEGAVVGAGAVVTKDVAPFTIVAGNPAKKIGDRDRGLDYSLKYNPWLM